MVKANDPIWRHVAEILEDPSGRASLFNVFPTLVWCCDAEGGCTFVNQAWEDYTGRNLELEAGSRWLQSVHSDDRATLERGWREAIGLRSAFEGQYRLRRADGEYGWIHHAAVPINNEHGRLAGYLGTCHDITERRAAELSAREQEERLRLFTEATNEGIIFHEEGRIGDCNDAILRLIGYRFEEIAGTPLARHFTPEHREAVLANELAGYERPFEAALLAKDGSRIPVEVESRTTEFKQREYRMSVVRDIRDRKAAEARIHFLAHHDTLTGLPNRALLLDRLEFFLASARRRNTHVGVLFIDLDHFKTVNDSLGHAAGDALLKVVARRIQTALRAGDAVGRLGGDEFLVILPDLDSEQGAVPAAEKLLGSIVLPLTLESQVVSVSPSIGISVFPRDGASSDDLIKNADAAMYLAKARGRNNFQFFNDGLAQAAFRSLAMEAKLREAIASEAFVLHYQPQMRMDSGELTGIEALIRWPQPDAEPIAPGDFLPVAEQRGLIRAIGSWVLREACRQNRAWQDEGLPRLPVAVNLSAAQFRQKNFVEEVHAALVDARLDPRYLCFELTESMLVEDAAAVVKTLESLKALGVRLAIDDFGTGHSSLVNLKRFPIDKIKIDRSFVRDVPGDPDDCAIVSAIIDLARTLGITSIAEGVDRVDQLEFLRRRGCQEVQGYLMSVALPPDRISHWLARPHTGTITNAEAV